MKLLTIKELANELRISLSLAYSLIARGEIPCYEIASCKRVSEEDLREYLELQKKERVNVPALSKRHF